jgi:hypothetical protein
MGNDFEMDNDARKLFEELGGIDTRERGHDLLASEAGLSDTLGEAEKNLDAWRILMVDLAYTFSKFLNSARISGITAKLEEEIETILGIITKLTQFRGRGREALMRYRGMAHLLAGKSIEKYDFTMTFGKLIVDIPVIRSVADRGGITLTHLTGRLKYAFESLSGIGIINVHLSIGAWNQKEKTFMARALQLLAAYFMASGKGGDPLSEASEESPPLVVYNENHQPDPNLTLLAGLNQLNGRFIQDLIHKVDGLLQKADSRSELQKFASVYEAIFAFKKLRKQLVRPPVEINNVRWLIVGKGEEVISQERARVAKTVIHEFGNAPRKAAQVMDSVYGNYTRDMVGNILPNRLGRVTDLLRAAERGGAIPLIEREVLQNIERRLNQLPDEIYDQLALKGNEIMGQSGMVAPISVPIHQKLSDMVTFFKRRSVTNKKMKQIIRHQIDFDSEDYETIAKDFDITTEDAAHLIVLLKDCFDANGRFQRKSFEKNIPAFAKYEKKVFEFLWFYLKGVMIRGDRVAFLNSMQALIDQMHQRKKAVLILLDDFLLTSEGITFSDRNALILSNVLIRKYNKELRKDIEITPEEVLLVRDGLDDSVIISASDYLEEAQDRIFNKIRTIHGNLKLSLNETSPEGQNIPLHYLLNLEREFNIFHALVGGLVPHMIVRGTLNEFGNPQADIYHLKRSQDEMKSLLQLLQVTTRGLGRFGNQGDLNLLRAVRAQEGEFIALKKDADHREMVVRLMKWIETVMKNIENTG